MSSYVKEAERIRRARRGFNVEAEVRVCGGFPAIALGCLERPDPSVGLFGRNISDVCIMTRDYRDADFISAKMKDADWDRVYEALFESLA